MAGVPQSTLQWLYDVLNQLNYRDPNRTYSHLAQSLAQCSSFGLRSAVYTFENGTSSLLVNLTGTIPVDFRNTTYRFPLTIWITQNYPNEPPLVYVTPTEDMVVRQGQHVSGADGKVYHHYLATWAQTPNQSHLPELLRRLADVFSREPPVMAKPRHQQPQRQSQTGSLPPSSPSAIRTIEGRPGQHSGGPPPPPKQRDGTSPQLPSTTSPPLAPKPGRYDVPPPLPQQSSSTSPRPPSMHANGHVQPPGGMNYMSQRSSYQQPLPQQHQATSSPGSGPPPPMLPQQQSPSQSPPGLQRAPQHQHANYNSPGPAQPIPRHGLPQQQFHGPPGGPPPSQHALPSQYVQQPPQQLQQPKQPQKDLLSEDDPFQLSLPTTQRNIPAPSIPPNPEKTALLSHLSHQILQHLHQSINQTTATAIPSLQSQYAALTQAQQTLTAELNNLHNFNTNLTSNIQALSQTLNQANATITSTKNPNHPSNPKNIPSIDEIIIPPSVIARQLYDNVSEQRGYETAIYALNEAFVRGRIGSELWSRKVRESAREEFRRKWMIRRIGEGLGLEGLVE